MALGRRRAMRPLQALAIRLGDPHKATYGWPSCRGASLVLVFFGP